MKSSSTSTRGEEEGFKQEIDNGYWHLAAATLLIGWKAEDVKLVAIDQMANKSMQIRGVLLSIERIKEMERRVLQELGFEVTFVTERTFVGWYLKAMGENEVKEIEAFERLQCVSHVSHFLLLPVSCLPFISI